MTTEKTKRRAEIEPVEDVLPGQQPTIEQAELAFERLLEEVPEVLGRKSVQLGSFFGPGGYPEDLGMDSHLVRKDFIAFAQEGGKATGVVFEDGVQKLAPLFTVVGGGRDPDKGEDALVIEFRDKHRHARRVVIPRVVIHAGDKQLAAFLAARGFEAPVGKPARFGLQVLLSAVPYKRVQIVANTGWVRGSDSPVFVLPGRIIGDLGEERIVPNTEAFANLKIAQSGTFQEWRDDVAAKAEGNSRLQLALGTAFASSLFRFAPNIGQTVVHIFGESSTGKSTALAAAGSCWGGADGDPLGFGHSWNSTANFHIANAAAHSGTLLCLDELHTAERVTKIAYTLASGQGRGRLDKDAQQRTTGRYRVMVLSTGELTLDEMEREAAGARRQTFAGAQIRLPSIPADAGAGLGLFEDIHEFAGKKRGAARFADALQSAARSHYGHAGPHFVERVIAHVKKGGEAEFRQELADMIHRFASSIELPERADDAVKRLLRTFGLIAAAGQLACRWNILPLDEQEFADGVATCFEAWITARGGARSKTSATALIELRDFLQRNVGKFHPVEGHKQPGSNEIAGYVETTNSGATIYYVLPGVWKTEIMAKAPRADLIAELDRLDLLVRQKSSSEAGKNQVVKKIGGKPVRAYAVSGDILSMGDDGKLDDGVIEAPVEEEAKGNVVSMAARDKHVMRQLHTRH